MQIKQLSFQIAVNRFMAPMSMTFFVCMSLFTGFITSFSAHAQNFIGCEFLLTTAPAQETLPPVIAHTPTDLHPSELHSAGELMSKASLSSLVDGKYVFLISSSFEVIFSPVYQIKNWGHEKTGLATHKSLLHQLNTNQPNTNQPNLDQISIVGSGEFQIQSGVVSSISNRSGNFRGTEIHFKHAIQKLSSLGLPLQAQTEMHIITAQSEDDWGHTPRSISYDEFQLKLREDIANNPELNELANKYLKLYHLLAKLFPGETAGQADLMAFLDFYSQVFAASSDYTYFFDFIEPLRLMHTADGMYFGLTSVYRKQNENIYVMFEEVIELLRASTSLAQRPDANFQF